MSEPILASTSSKIKAIALIFWTATVVFFTCAMFLALASQSPDPGQSVDQHNAAVGGAYVIVTGCAGGGWLCGLLVIVLIAAVLRD